MKYLILLVLISCASNPPVSKDIKQGYLLGCLMILNEVAFSDTFTDEQYDFLYHKYIKQCSTFENL